MHLCNTLFQRRNGAVLAALCSGALALAAAVTGCGSNNNGGPSGLPGDKASLDQVTRGRYLTMSLACGDCHNRGKVDPNDPNWLAGYMPGTPGQPFQIGPFQTYPANITPDTTTGIGRFTDRQIYNELRYGLDPMDTPDVVITSTTPGQGNFPATPHYLAPPMPWPSFRHLTDSDLWSIVAYIKHGIKPVANTVPASTEPPDFWASSYTPDKIGPDQLPAYPGTNETYSP